jgi:NAD(P)-dependent dehydrogenase (short-subunit alcohol dehydrogenase family)
LAEKSAVVTGAAMGIGRATTRRLISEGVHVVAVDVDADALAQSFGQSGEVTHLIGDVCDWDTHAEAALTAENIAPMAYWVNNAARDIRGSAHTVTEAEMRSGYDLLALAPLFGTAIAVRTMIPHGSGSIVTISSIQGVAAFPDYYIYGTAKAALIQSARSVAIDYGSKGIRSNVILPGTIDTEMARATIPPDADAEEFMRQAGAIAPQGRVGTPEEVASAVWFLLSDESSYINGTAITVDGGSTARCFPIG